MLILFDVDGTLLLCHRAGAKAMQQAGKRVVGDAFDLRGVGFAGGLDPLIFADGLRRAGQTNGEALHARFRATYARCLAARFARSPTAYLLPGVESLLARLRARPDVTLGLVTGNYPETGRLKLETAGLDPTMFEVHGWGDAGPTRRHLPAVAMAAYAERHGERIDPRRVIVIGDTPADVDCARANDCRVVSVATGPSHDRAALAACSPDLLLDDLSDTEAFLAWLDDLPPAQAESASEGDDVDFDDDAEDAEDGRRRSS